jgi:protein-L-isoaspartate(D-aspartate) O-methyltransferase
MVDEYQIPRERMIQMLREHYKIADENVLEVMRRTPRHLFVPEALKSQAYKDNALPIAANQTISQPFIGYQTVILSQLAREVYAIERVPQLANEAQKRLQSFGIQNVTLRCADGTNGWEANAPYDVILVAAAGPSVPKPLLSQLKIGGKLIVPVGQDQKTQKLIRVTRTADDFQTEDFGACAFVPLIGEHGWQNNT